MLLTEVGNSLNSQSISEINNYLSHFIPAIDDASNKVNQVVHKTGVLFLGMTGEGKSTLLNYLYGVNYQKHVVSGIKRVQSLTQELIKTGSSTISETLYPQVIQFPAQPYVAIELPGFGDTRGEIEETCAALSISALTNHLDALQALFLVSSWNSLESSKMLNYRHAASCLGALINNDPSTAENLILIVTNPEEDLTVDDVRERLRDFSNSEGWSRGVITNQEDVTNDVWKKHCIRNVTEALLSREGNIVLADVTTDKTRVEFQKVVATLQRIVKRPDQFNFKCYSLFVDKFQKILKKYAFDCVQGAVYQDKLMISLQEGSYLILSKENELNELLNKLNDLSQYAFRFDSRPHDQIQQSIQSLKMSLATFSYEKKNYENQLCEIHCLIVALASDVTERKKSLWAGINIDFDKLGQMLMEMETMNCLMSNDSKIKYHLSSSQITLSGVLTSAKEVLSKIRTQLLASVFQRGVQPAPFRLEFFNVYQNCNTPENKSRLQELRQQLEGIQQLLEKNREGSWVIEDQIRQYEFLESEERMKMENAKILYAHHLSIKKEELNANILKLKVEIGVLLNKNEKLRGTIGFSQMHQRANQALSLKVCQMIKILNFQDQIFCDFNACLH